MISRIEAYNYRCFPDLGVDLGRYQVLAGANGAGKTTLLDIPVLLGDLLRQRNAVGAFLERSPFGQPPRATTLAELLHKGQGDMIAFAIEARLPAQVIEPLARGRASRPGRPLPSGKICAAPRRRGTRRDCSLQVGMRLGSRSGCSSEIRLKSPPGSHSSGPPYRKSPTSEQSSAKKITMRTSRSTMSVDTV